MKDIVQAMPADVYAELDAGTRDTLKAVATRLHELGRKGAEMSREIARHLLQARQVSKEPVFRAWLEQEFGDSLSYQQALDYLKIGERELKFPAAVDEIARRGNTSALIEACRPSTPDEVTLAVASGAIPARRADIRAVVAQIKYQHEQKAASAPLSSEQQGAGPALETVKKLFNLLYGPFFASVAAIGDYDAQVELLASALDGYEDEVRIARARALYAVGQLLQDAAEQHLNAE